MIKHLADYVLIWAGGKSSSIFGCSCSSCVRVNNAAVDVILVVLCLHCVFFCAGGGDDLAKSPHMARIGKN